MELAPSGDSGLTAAEAGADASSEASSTDDRREPCVLLSLFADAGSGFIRVYVRFAPSSPSPSSSKPTPEARGASDNERVPMSASSSSTERLPKSLGEFGNLFESPEPVSC